MIFTSFIIIKGYANLLCLEKDPEKEELNPKVSLKLLKDLTFQEENSDSNTLGLGYSADKKSILSSSANESKTSLDSEEQDQKPSFAKIKSMTDGMHYPILEENNDNSGRSR